MRIAVKESAKLFVNGRQFVFEPGIHEIDEDKARILIQAGYATEVKEEKQKKEKTK